MRQLGGPIAVSSKVSAGEVATAALQSLEQRLVEAVGELERLALNSTKGSKGTPGWNLKKVHIACSN